MQAVPCLTCQECPPETCFACTINEWDQVVIDINLTFLHRATQASNPQSERALLRSASYITPSIDILSSSLTFLIICRTLLARFGMFLKLKA